MGWATAYIAKLKEGEEVSFRPKGNSMLPRIRSGDLCTVSPVPLSEIQAGDVVLCKVHGREFLHLVKAIKNGSYLIANNRGHINGWVGASSVYGKLTKVEP